MGGSSDLSSSKYLPPSVRRKNAPKALRNGLFRFFAPSLLDFLQAAWVSSKTTAKNTALEHTL
jgi:hypothetical protein